MSTTRSTPARLPTGSVAATATVRLAMRALTATGHYAEAEDSFEWLVREAADVVAAIESRAGHAGQVAAVMAVLADTAFHKADDLVEAACLRRDAETVVFAVTTGAVVGDAGSRDGLRR